MSHFPRLLCILALLFALPAGAADLAQTIERVKPSVVGIGTLIQTRSPPASFVGTGFVVGDGTLVATNYHVVPAILDPEKRETVAVLIPRGDKMEIRSATKVASDPEHDLLLLKMVGTPLPALTLADSDRAREGEMLAFTGFPIGVVLGLYPVTHQAMVSAITPIAVPQQSARSLDIKVVNRLKHPYRVIQLDGTAYPSNSGSPLYHPDSGAVVGLVNRAFIKESKESVLSNPSGISYAIPSNYLRDLLRKYAAGTAAPN